MLSWTSFHQYSTQYFFQLCKSRMRQRMQFSLIDLMVFNAVFNIISVILQRTVLLSMLSWTSFHQYSTRYSFPPSHRNNNGQYVVREEWILSQWLSLILGKNVGRSGDWSSYLLFSSPLTPRNFFNQAIPTFNDLEKESFLKLCGKRRKCWWPAFSPFPTMFSTHSKWNFNFLSRKCFQFGQVWNFVIW